MTLSQQDRDMIAKLMELEAKATKGPWEIDYDACDGEYGSGEDVYSGYSEYSVFSNGKDYFGKSARVAVMDGECAEIEEEFDEDGHHAWDEQGRSDAAFIAESRNAIPRLLEIIKELEAEVERLTPVERKGPMVGDICHSCHKVFEGTCSKGGCPMGGDF